jgi:hypothetical protein
MPNGNNNRGLWALIAVVVIGLLAWVVLSAPDNRTTGERVGDAIDELPNGLDEAGQELQDKSAADRVGDAVEDAGDELERDLSE